MNYKLEVIKDNIAEDITNQSGNINWSSDEETLSVNFTFDFAEVSKKVEPGDIIKFINLETNKNIFTGIVVNKTKGDLVSNISCYDFCFYLNKSEVVIQFNKVSASNALKILLDKFNISYKQIDEMNTVISKIYKDIPISDVVFDILDQVYLETKKKYILEIEGNELLIIEQSKQIINAEVKLARNLSSFSISKLIGKASKVTESIESLRNSIVIVSSDEKRNKIIKSLKDDLSIKKYGLLQEVVTVDDKNESQARNIAKNLLSELNKVFKSSNIQLLGNDSVKAGRIIILNEPTLSLIGEYKIKNAAHSIASNIYMMNLTLDELLEG